MPPMSLVRTSSTIENRGAWLRNDSALNGTMKTTENQVGFTTQIQTSSEFMKFPLDRSLQTSGASLWEEALRRLSESEKNDLELIHDEIYASPNSILSVVKDKQDECLRKRWVLYKNEYGEEVLFRDVLERVSEWIEKFQEIGDDLIRFDPGYAMIPWAIVRTIMQASFLHV